MVRISIPEFSSLPIDSNVNDMQATDSDVSNIQGSISSTYQGKNANQYGGISSSEIETMDFDATQAPDSGTFTTKNPISPNGSNTSPQRVSDPTLTQTTPGGPGNGNASPQGNLASNGGTNPSVNQASVLTRNNEINSPRGSGSQDSTPTTASPTPRSNTPSGSSGPTGSYQPATPGANTPQQRGGDAEAGVNGLATGDNNAPTATPSTPITIESVDPDTVLTITQTDENNAPVEVEMTFGELVQMFREMGFSDEDINRVLAGEISLPDLINEILQDSAHPERRLSLFLSAYLSTDNFYGCKTLDDLQALIDTTKSEIRRINNVRYDLYDEEIRLDALLYVILTLQDSNNNLDMDWILRGEIPLFVIVDEDGGRHYVNAETYKETPYDNLTNEVVYLTYGEVLSEDPLYQQLLRHIVDYSYEERWLWITSTVTKPALDGTPECVELVNQINLRYQDTTSQIASFNAQLDEKNMTLVQTNDLLYTFNTQNENVYNYTYAADFAENSNFNVDSLSFKDKYIEKYFEPLRRDPNEDRKDGPENYYVTEPSRRDSNNDRKDGPEDYRVTITDKTEIVNIISCVLNRQGIYSYGGAPYIIDGDAYAIVYFDSIDGMISDFGQYMRLFTDSEGNVFSAITDEEVKVFNYILNTEGVDAAYEWLLSMYDIFEARWLYYKMLEDQEFATEHPYLASFMAIFAKPFEGMWALRYSMSAKSLDYQIRRNKVYSSADVWTQTVSNLIIIERANIYVQRMGYDSLEVAPVEVVEAATAYGERGAFWYNTGMSMCTSALNYALCIVVTLPLGGIGVFAAKAIQVVITFAIMGTSAYASTLNDALDRGLSDGQAVALAWASAVTETAMESWSLGHLMNLEKHLGKGVLSIAKGIDNKFLKGLFLYGASAISQGICEGEEEICTQIIESFFDYVYAGELSHYHLDVQRYLDQGYTEQESMEFAIKDNWKQLKIAFLGGFISGVTFGLIGGGFKMHSIHYNLAMDIMNQYEGIEKSVSRAEALRSVTIDDVIAELESQNASKELLGEIQKDIRQANYAAAISGIKTAIKSIFLGNTNTQLNNNNSASEQSSEVDGVRANNNTARFNTNPNNVVLTAECNIRAKMASLVSMLENSSQVSNVGQNLIARFNNLSESQQKAIDGLSKYYQSIKNNIKNNSQIDIEQYRLAKFLDIILSKDFKRQAEYFTVLLDEGYYRITDTGLQELWDLVPNGGKDITSAMSRALFKTLAPGQSFNGIKVESRPDGRTVRINVGDVSTLDSQGRIVLTGNVNADGTITQGTIYIERLRVGQQLAVLSYDDGGTPGRYYVDLAQFGPDAIVDGQLRMDVEQKIRESVAVDLQKETLANIIVMEITETLPDLIAIYSRNAPAFASNGGIIQMQVVSPIVDGHIIIEYKKYGEANWAEKNTMTIEAMQKQGVEFREVVDGRTFKNFNYVIEQEIKYMIKIGTNNGQSVSVVVNEAMMQLRTLYSYNISQADIQTMLKHGMHLNEIILLHDKMNITNVKTITQIYDVFLSSSNLTFEEYINFIHQLNIMNNTNMDLGKVQALLAYGMSPLEILIIYNEMGISDVGQIINVYDGFLKTKNVTFGEYIDSLNDKAFGNVGNNYVPRRANFSLFSNATTRGLNAFFERYNRAGWNYGADQGFIKQQFSEDVIHHIKTGTAEYFRLKNLLVSQGFTSRSASMILKGLDSVGACSYAAIANGIFNAFKDNPARFREIFGYDMITTIDGEEILNTGELLIDLYTFINDESNGGRLFRTNLDGTKQVLVIDLLNKDMFGRTLLDAEEQKYLSGYYGLNSNVISKFLMSKSPSLTTDFSALAQYDGSQVIDNIQMQVIVNNVIRALNSGKNVHLGIYSSGGEIRLLGLDNYTPNYSTRTWNEGGGHATFITEVRSDGFVVSSWGKKLLIPFADLQNGGRFQITEWSIDGVTKTMTPFEISVSDDILYAFNMLYQKYGPKAVEYIIVFMNTGNFNAITRYGDARARLQQYSYTQIMHVINNYININDVLNIMMNGNQTGIDFQTDGIVNNNSLGDIMPYQELLRKINFERGLSPEKRIEYRRSIHENTSFDVTNAYRLRLLTDLDVIRSGNNIDVAFDDLRLMFGNISNDDLLSRACAVQTALLNASTHKVDNSMVIQFNIYGDSPNMAITTARVKKYISQLPTEMSLVLREINIYDERCPSDIYWKIHRDYKGDFVSAVTGGGGVINIWNGRIGMSYYDGMGTIIHETAHSIDTLLGNGYFWTNIDGIWSDAMWKDKQTLANFYISDYASESQSIQEDFADSLMEYMKNPEAFTRLAPYRAEIIIRISTTLFNYYINPNNTLVIPPLGIETPEIIEISD